MKVSFKGRDVEIVTLDLAGFRRMAELQDRLLEPMPDSLTARAEALIEITTGLARLYAPSLSDADTITATFDDLAPILTAGAEVNNPGQVFAAAAPKPRKPQFSDGLLSLAGVMHAPANARKVASRKRAEEIIRLHKEGRVPVA